MADAPYSAIVRLGATDEFRLVRDWLKAELAEQDKQNRRLRGDDLHRGQGKALYLETLLEQSDPEYARDILRRTQQR